jgi:hypothetical protein
MALGAQGGGADEPHKAAPTSEPPKDPLVQLAEGFAMGMQAGRAMRERRY